MKNINDLNLENKTVLIRADLNVPLNDQLEITDANRIVQFLPTLQLVLEKGGKAIICSHLGRPEGAKNEKYSLKPVQKKLEELTKKSVQLAPDCIGIETKKIVDGMQPGDIVVLENLRFHKAEQKGDESFAKELASLAEVYIGDAFATAHRADASMVAVPALFTEKAAGLLMQKEVDYYKRTLVTPNRPLCVILGGAKISTKLKTLKNLADKADKIIIGGAMANTFLAAQGFQMGRSLYEPDMFQTALSILGNLARRDCKMYLPVDFRVGESPKWKGEVRSVPAQEVPADMMALDIGPATSLLYAQAITTAATIVWNGPMGCFENEAFAQGTTDLITSLGSALGLTVAGGGDTDAAIHQMELEHKFDFISTGGGAFLALLEGESLPGFKALGIEL